MRASHLPIRTATLALLLVVSAATAGQPLAYRFPAGASFAQTMVSHADVPVVGAVTTTTNLATKVVAVDDSGMRVEQTVVNHAPRHGLLRFVMTAHLSPEGLVTDIAGVDWGNAEQALVAKNAANGMPRLPNEPVNVGSIWQDEKPIYLPKAPIPGIPEVVRVQTTYTVRSISAGPRPLVTIVTKAQESPGQKAKIAATGTLVVEAATGMPVKSHVKGLATFKLLISSVKVPFSMDLTSN